MDLLIGLFSGPSVSVWASEWLHPHVLYMDNDNIVQCKGVVIFWNDEK